MLKILIYYSNQEMANMHFMYGRVNENASIAQCLYTQKFRIYKTICISETIEFSTYVY